MRIIWCTTLCALVSAVLSSKILLVPFDHGAHVNFFSVIGETIQNAGHEVYVLFPLQHEQIVAKYKLHRIPVDYNVRINTIQEEVGNKGNTNLMSLVPKLIGQTNKQIRQLFSEDKLMKKLEDMKFDLMIMDGAGFIRHIYALPYKLGVPFISLTPMLEPWMARVPSLPSVEGMIPFVTITEESTIVDRIINTLGFVAGHVMTTSSFSFIDDNMLSELVPEKTNIGYFKLYHQSEIILINFDMICLDYHRVSSPYYQFIGGVGAQPPKPLTADLDKIMKSSTQDVIVLTFGSGMKTLPLHMLKKMFEVFKDIKQTVIMRHNPTEETKEKNLVIPPNVHIRSWLPQNDLLGHPKTKLFITHAGNNGQLEAVYHGVPVLAMPLFGDQPYNARRAVLKGFGKELNPNSFTTDELRDTITELLQNRSYYGAIQKCSHILKDLPSPQKQTLFWVEHILKFGGSHLRPFYLDMPLWKFFMLDVLLVFLVIVVMIVILLKWCICRCCFSQKRKHIKKE